jgi:hypothetical protein
VPSDPEGVFSFQNVLFVVNKAKYEALGGPAFMAINNTVNSLLTASAIQSMNEAVLIDKEAADVAGQFLKASGLAGGSGSQAAIVDPRARVRPRPRVHSLSPRRRRRRDSRSRARALRPRGPGSTAPELGGDGALHARAAGSAEPLPRSGSSGPTADSGARSGGRRALLAWATGTVRGASRGGVTCSARWWATAE